MFKATRGVQPLFRTTCRNMLKPKFQTRQFSQKMVKNGISDPIAIAAGTIIVGGIVVGMLMKKKCCGEYPPTGLSPQAKKCPQWIQSGLGDAEYIGVFTKEDGTKVDCSFSADKTPDKMPDLSKHTNFLGDVLNAHPELYDACKNRVTKNGVTLAKCIKTGVDNPGHPMIKTCGIVAGDEESWTVFKEVFDPIVSARHGGYAADAVHTSDLDWNKLSTTKIDPTCDENGNCKYVLTSRIRTGRSVRGMKLPPSITFEERRELERIVTSGLCNLGKYKTPYGEIDLTGEYWPLHGSRSYCKKKGGMSHEKEDFLRDRGNLFQEPDSTLLLSSGMGRHWPDGRGIYHNAKENFFVWLNEEDHMRIISMEKGDGIKKIFVRFATACNEVQAVLKKEGYDFMHSDHLGYILTCPSNLGTGLRAGALLRLPHFSKRSDFKKIAGSMGLQVRGRRGVDSASEGGIYDISNADRLGKSEVVLVNKFIEGAAQFIKWEQMLEKGQSIDHLVPKV